MHILYMLAQAPHGPGEQFIITEIEEMQRQGIQITVFPVRPDKEPAAGISPSLAAAVQYRPFCSPRSLFLAFRYFCKHPIKSLRVFGRLFHKPAKTIFKNLLFYGKGLETADLIDHLRPDFIHCHWGSTPSTSAMIASTLTGVPWGLTCHRFDIYENNLLRQKTLSASFVRLINQKGLADFQKLIHLPEHKEKLHVIHCGVQPLPYHNSVVNSVFSLVCPAHYIPVKGHTYLLQALEKLMETESGFRLDCYGTGPLEERLKNEVIQRGLENHVFIHPQIPHGRLMEYYISGKVDCVILPSIHFRSFEHEGIPVALMEAMSAGIPVISTSTGGIPELVDDSTGILCPAENPDALCKAVLSLIQNPLLRGKLGGRAREKICADFSVKSSVDQLLALIHTVILK